MAQARKELNSADVEPEEDPQAKDRRLRFWESRSGKSWLWLKEPEFQTGCPGKRKHGPRPAVCPSDRLILSHTQLDVCGSDTFSHFDRLMAFCLFVRIWSPSARASSDLPLARIGERHCTREASDMGVPGKELVQVSSRSVAVSVRAPDRRIGCSWSCKRGKSLSSRSPCFTSRFAFSVSFSSCSIQVYNCSFHSLAQNCSHQSWSCRIFLA